MLNFKPLMNNDYFRDKFPIDRSFVCGIKIISTPSEQKNVVKECVSYSNYIPSFHSSDMI